MPFFLERIDSNGDIICLNCEQNLDILWNEENCDGTYVKDCPNCGQELEIEVETEIRYYASIYFKD